MQPAQEVKRKAVQYETGFTLPPGKYRLKVVLRENQSGAIGSYESDVVVPDVRRSPMKLSSVVLGTQTQPVVAAQHRQSAGSQRHDARAQPDPRRLDRAAALLLLRGLRAGARAVGHAAAAHEHRVLPRQGARPTKRRWSRSRRLDAPDRKAAIFQFAVPASALKPGYYTCQITVVDDVAGTFAFPRLPLLVRQ